MGSRKNSDNDQLDAVFFSLASEPRRRILDVLKQEPGCNVNRVCDYFENDIGRFAVMKHLATLEAAGLVIAERSGRERACWFDPTPIQWIHERWTTELQRLLGRPPDPAQVQRRGRRSARASSNPNERTGRRHG